MRFLNYYREASQRVHGYTASSDQIGWAAPVYVADTDAQAREEAGRHVEILFNKLLRLPFQMLFPPGYLSAKSLKNMLTHKRSVSGQEHTIDSLIEQGIMLCGSPETVRKRLDGQPSPAGLPEFPGAAAVRHAAARSHGEEHQDVCARGAAGAAAAQRQGICRAADRRRRSSSERTGAGRGRSRFQ